LTDWTEAQIISLAEPTASDVAEAAAAWREAAPVPAKRLLDAVEEETVT
jgi:hypothetical protein